MPLVDVELDHGAARLGGCEREPDEVGDRGRGNSPR